MDIGLLIASSITQPVTQPVTQSEDHVSDAAISYDAQLTCKIADHRGKGYGQLPHREQYKTLLLPAPERAPLSINFLKDPILDYTKTYTPAPVFCDLVQPAIVQHPSVIEASAGHYEAGAAKREATSALFPTVDVSISNRTSIVRNFATDTDNLVERARSRSRTDATFNLQQRIFDFGAAPKRAQAAGARIEAARFEVERQADQVALDAVAAWYDVFAYRALTELSANMSERHAEMRSAMEMRISLGASAKGDLARIDGFIASHQARHAGIQRQLASAEALFFEFYDTTPPKSLGRVAGHDQRYPNKEAIREAAQDNPVVKLINAQSRSAALEARAARADTKPSISAGLEGGRFGFLGSSNDYDVRGTLALNHRFLGSGDARADQAESRADAARARATRVANEASTQATIALSDLEALNAQIIATEENYIAQRQSRDVLYERFRTTRGTLFDVMEADRTLFEAAVSHIQTVSERDAAHHVLLSRVGKLLGEMGIDTRRLLDQ